MGPKCADQGWALIEDVGGSVLDEVYLTEANIDSLQKQTGIMLFAGCFSSCDPHDGA